MIYIFKSTFYNFYLSKFSRDNVEEIRVYVQKLLRYGLPYFGVILFIALCSAACVSYIYADMGSYTWKVLFILLIQTGTICYLGMFTLLAKTLNYLNLEVGLNIVRILLIWAICNLWTGSNMLVWYGVTQFLLMTPEIIISAFILGKLNYTK